MGSSLEDSNASTALVPLKDGAQKIRDHIVTTAVKFLQNPKVRSTPLSKKQEFLRRKGLTEEEVDLACQKAGAYLEEEDENNNRGGKGGALVPQGYGTGTSTRTSLLLKAMDVANMIALISIGSYSLYSLWKNYIAPRIFGTRSRLEQKYERLLDSITQLNQNVVELRELFRDVQLNTLSSPKSLEIQELKKEIASIKSLLLGRSQFPSPTTSTSIPSWQMVEGDNSNENSDESSKDRRRPKKDKDKSSSSRKSQLLQSDLRSEEDQGGPMRKHPSLDSNNGFQSESSCEVVFMGKTDSSDPDHSE